MYELSVGADRIISYILYVPSNFLKAAPKMGRRINELLALFCLGCFFTFIIEIHSKQLFNQHSKFNTKIANLLTAQIIALPTIATRNIQ